MLGFDSTAYRRLNFPMHWYPGPKRAPNTHAQYFCPTGGYWFSYQTPIYIQKMRKKGWVWVPPCPAFYGWDWYLYPTFIFCIGKREKNYGYGYPPCPAFFGWVLVPVPNIYILYRKNEKKWWVWVPPCPAFCTCTQHLNDGYRLLSKLTSPLDFASKIFTPRPYHLKIFFWNLRPTTLCRWIFF